MLTLIISKDEDKRRKVFVFLPEKTILKARNLDFHTPFLSLLSPSTSQLFILGR